MNTKTNRAEVTVDEETDDFPLARLRALNAETRDLADRGEFLSTQTYPTGTSVSIELEGKYQKGRGSIDEFLELTAIANPHAKFTLVRPSRTTEDEEDVPLLKKKAAPDAAATPEEPAPAEQPQVTQDLGTLVVFPRGVTELPPETKEIQPHPRGVELGTLLQMLKDYELAEKGGTLYTFLQEKFSRVSSQTASAFCQKIGVTSRTKAADVEPQQAEKLYKEFMEAKLPPPPTDCLAPIGVQQMLKGMHKGVRAEFYAASSREAAVYRGRPFLIEAAVAFGGQLAADDSARVIRFANRVPLLFQQSACSSFKAVSETNWRNYDLQHPRGGLPVGPLVVMIHMASVWVPFTSESKEAIADYDEIRKEMKLALMECGASSEPTCASAQDAPRGRAPRRLRTLHRRDLPGDQRHQRHRRQEALRGAAYTGQETHRHRRPRVERRREGDQGRGPGRPGRGAHHRVGANRRFRRRGGHTGPDQDRRRSEGRGQGRQEGPQGC
ncbi:MAG: DNA topoisomerase VI subunit B [Phycisphaerales bacterium]